MSNAVRSELWNRSSGFSLVELTVVLLLITLITSVAVRETSELGFQVRYDQTKERLDIIKQAILGNPKQIINGQQAISGFVADMGRLPDQLRELLQMGYCATATAANPPLPAEIVVASRTPLSCTGTNEWRWTSTPCTDGTSDFTGCTGGHLWLGRQTETVTSGLSFGWNGPYLSISGSPGDQDALTDGWGKTSNDQNYGWRVEPGLTLTNLGDANAANDQVDVNGYVRLVVQSLGKDQVLGQMPVDTMDDDYPDNVRSNDAGTPVYYPDPLVDKADWLLDVSNGLSVSLTTHGTTFCGFGSNLPTSINAMSGNSIKLRACRNASGRWRASGCYLDQSSCSDINAKDTGSSNTLWNSQINACVIAQPDCTGSGFIWDVNTESCHIDKTACAALTHSGIWTASGSCQLEATECEALAGVGRWNSVTGICEFDSTTCAGANGTWDASINSCDLKPSTTHAGKCDTDSTAPDNDTGTWGCNISQANCTVSGGAWNRCDYSPAQCLSFTGGSFVSQCEFTASLCTRSGGVWQPNPAICQFNATTCGNLGGSWDAINSRCDFNATSCPNAGANWYSFCAIDTSANCTAIGGNWNANTLICEFNDTQCMLNGGKPREGDCSIPRAEHDGAPYNQQTCQTASGIWNPQEKALCINIFYRKNGDLVRTASLPTLIGEDGTQQSVQFSFLRTDSTICVDNSHNGIWDGAQCVYNIPEGQNAVGLYEYDGDCDPNNTFYPADRQHPIQIDFHPNALLPVINW